METLNEYVNVTLGKQFAVANKTKKVVEIQYGNCLNSFVMEEKFSEILLYQSIGDGKDLKQITLECNYRLLC